MHEYYVGLLGGTMSGWIQVGDYELQCKTGDAYEMIRIVDAGASVGWSVEISAPFYLDEYSLRALNRVLARHRDSFDMLKRVWGEDNGERILAAYVFEDYLVPTYEKHFDTFDKAADYVDAITEG